MDEAIDEEAAMPQLSHHPLIRELGLPIAQLVDLIASARRLKMAIRGWVAEEHLAATISRVPGVTNCERIDQEGSADLRLRYLGRQPILIECKNVLRKLNREGLPRLDFQRTRAAKTDPCSRYYAVADFHVVAACLHAVTERWEFRYAPTVILDSHAICTHKLASNVLVDG